MLVITRKEQESIFIFTESGPIRIKVVSAGTRVRVGFEAPESVRILRAEVVEREQESTTQEPSGVLQLPIKGRGSRKQFKDVG